MISSPMLDALARGAQVLTSSQRAARALERAYGEHCRAAGRRGWRAPAITDWACWVEGLARQVDLGRTVLSSLQELHLWQRVQREEAQWVVAPARLAELACGAYGLLSKYRAHPSRRASWAAAHDDAERFLRWADEFDAFCEKLGVLPRCELEAALAARAGELAAPAELVLVGFERMTPSQEALLGALGCAVTALEESEGSEARIAEAVEESEELRACAQWAREQAEQGRRAGVLVPDLKRQRAALDRALRRALEPESARRAVTAQAPVFEFSLGVPLAEVPLASAALLLLRWCSGQTLSAAEVSALLTGDFLAVSPEEALALAQADATMRREGLLGTEVSLRAFLRADRSHGGKPSRLLPQAFAARMGSALDLLGRGDARAYAEWAELVPDLLQAAGWPGYRELSSTAFQARERWKRLLEETAAVGLVAGETGWRRFVQELREAAANALFAAESREAPVQVLGLPEAAGLRFDAVWVLGMHEGCWPAGGRLHPLLAPGVQKDAGMPFTNPEAERAFAEAQLARILRSAPEVVLSYARQVEGGLEGRLAPLAAALGLKVEPANAPKVDGARETRNDADATHGPAWPENRSPGGSEVLRRQAACGFQGFAARRLGAEPLEGAARGLDAGERGALLHRALERLWSAEEGPGQLHSWADLKRAQAEGRLEGLVEAAVERAFAGAMREAAGDRWRLEYLRLERHRVRTRLRRWLAEEGERAPFSVAALEKKAEAAVGPLTLRLRMDRIDALEGGGHMLLDYKTGAQVNVRQWMGERMEEPQLPIYAEFGGIDQVESVAFAQIRPGQTKLHLLAGEELLGIRESWREALIGFAEDFARGEARVDPRDGAATCRYCGLQGVCRVGVLSE